MGDRSPGEVAAEARALVDALLAEGSSGGE